jgi:hypothetical protein
MQKQGLKNETAYAVLNPSGLQRPVESIPLSDRLPELGGKVIYCISQYIGGADTFLEKVAKAIPEFAPGIKTVFRRKPAAYMTDDPELWDEIEAEADAVIYGCGA